MNKLLNFFLYKLEIFYSKHKFINLKILVPREPVNGFSHLLGMVLAICGLGLLIKHLPPDCGVAPVVAAIIFGSSLILLYMASSCYHLLNVSDRVLAVLRRVDHLMIFILIAGTYTPLCIIALDGAWKWGMLTAIWLLAICGVVFKLVWFHAPRWLSTSLYIIMGWLVVVALYPLKASVALKGMVFLFLGGIFYTVGAVIYARQKPNFIKGLLGFHEVFHLFVIAGSTAHFWLIYRYILVLA